MGNQAPHIPRRSNFPPPPIFLLPLWPLLVGEPRHCLCVHSSEEKRGFRPTLLDGCSTTNPLMRHAAF